MVVQGYLLSILVQLKEYAMCYQENIKYDSTAAHLELYETCMPERCCENNEQLKEVIYFVKDLHHRSFTGL